MEKINVGVVNLLISNKLKDEYVTGNFIDESKKLAGNLLEIIRNSPILQLEFKIFNNIENKYIENDFLATRYIDSNIKLFEIYTAKEIDAEHDKLKIFIDETYSPQNNDKIRLYNAIHDLISGSLNDYHNLDINTIHESFTCVLNHIKTPKIDTVDSTHDTLINENIIELAIDKFNSKYSSLNENDKTMLSKLIKSNDDEKKIMFEDYKKENILLLENIKENISKDDINNAIQKINGMVCNENSLDENIIHLYELREGLING